MRINENFSKLKDDYIFAELAKKVAAARAVYGEKIIDLGIGDVKLPLPKIFAEEMKKASEDMAKRETFTGYPPAGGFPFLKAAVSREYARDGADVSEDEIFITDGAKSELGNVAELFGRGIKVLFAAPCYPAGAETNVLLGNDVEFVHAREEDDFIPRPPYGKAYDLIYLCSPNNPTGSAFSHGELKEWIDYAITTGAVIIYDGAYSRYISGDFPKTVYAVRGADRCAVEIRSFSKSLGFTGIRCGFTVVPKNLGNLNSLMKRRAGARFNGVSVISQRGAAVAFTEEGRKKAAERINFYKTNASILKIAFQKKKMWYNKSCSSPYVFVKCPDGLTADGYCDALLCKAGISATPARGFLCDGDYVRFSAFQTREAVSEAAARIENLK